MTDPVDLDPVIELWRAAFRRGEPLVLQEQQVKLEAAAAAMEEYDRQQLWEKVWADRPGDTLLIPKLVSALREAIDAGWRFAIVASAVPISPTGTGATFTPLYHADLYSPSGQFHTAADPDRSKAVMHVLDLVGITY